MIISHRGNLKGPNPARENHPDYIDAAIRLEYTVEVDLKAVDDELYLGHDYPQYHVTPEWIMQRRQNLLIHMKCLSAVQWFSFNSSLRECHYFCHSHDPYTLTSQGLIWLHDISQRWGPRMIVPLITEDLVKNALGGEQFMRCNGICTDFPTLIN